MNHVGPASIVINNHNYGRFLRDAIDSALSQSYPQTEVIVVDDGSTDHSREIIAEYGDRVVPLLKENGGQPSAFNSGFRMSRGDVIVFLDADDLLAASAVEQAMKLFVTGDVAKVHWPLRDIDGHGRETGDVTPRRPLPEGDLREGVVRDGPEAYLSAPTTGNAWARTFLQKVLPLPEIDGYRYGGADVYLSTLAPLFGRVKALAQPQGCYRLHGENNYARLHFDEKFQQDLWCYDNRCEALSRHCREMGLDVNPESWKRNSWLHRFPQAREEIAERIPLGESLILVDQEELGSAVAPCCNTIPFLERDGRYWGAPPDDATAIQELVRLRQSGANFIVFAWPAFWWLDYYAKLHDYLRSRFPCVLENERLILFDLRPSTTCRSAACTASNSEHREVGCV